MHQLKQLKPGIIEVIYAGEFTLQDWAEYQELMLEQLNQSSGKLYILTNFLQTTRLDKEILPLVGSAKHLTHPNLGLIVLLGGNAFQNFILLLTENRAMKEEKGSRLRIHRDYDRALEMLEYQQTIEAKAGE
ncbi:MAG TPA: hypothetical protein VHO69_16555 [Phototrophicaceae bacterium]|nr:hypothetical protein [Phototrophicaceae bacterium]